MNGAKEFLFGYSFCTVVRNPLIYGRMARGNESNCFIWGQGLQAR